MSPVEPVVSQKRKAYPAKNIIPENLNATYTEECVIRVLNSCRANLYAHRLQLQICYLDVKRIGIKVSAEPCHHVLVVLMTGVSDSLEQIRVPIGAAAVLWRARTLAG